MRSVWRRGGERGGVGRGHPFPPFGARAAHPRRRRNAAPCRPRVARVGTASRKPSLAALTARDGALGPSVFPLTSHRPGSSQEPRVTPERGRPLVEEIRSPRSQSGALLWWRVPAVCAPSPPRCTLRASLSAGLSHPGLRGTAPQVFSGTAVAERQSLSGDPGGLACLPVQGSLHWVQCLQSTASDRVEPL